MNIFKIFVAALLVLLALSACGGGGGGGGGGGSGGGAAQPTTPARTIVSGVASKGLLINGTVNIFAVSNGTKSALLNSASTDDNGRFTIDLGTYVGPILAEASGSYLDEASGTTKTISADNPLRAALSLAQGDVTLAVTALTELAVRNAGANLTADAVTTANSLVSQLFKVDIINIQPVAPTAVALASATQAQKDYTLALATISQAAKDSGAGLDSTLASLPQGITSTGMTNVTITKLRTSLTNFVTSNTSNQSGISDTFTTSLVNVGTLSKGYKLAVTGTVATGIIKGIQFDLVLPAGVNLNLNGKNSAVLSSSLSLSGAASAEGLFAKYTSGTLTVGIISSAGLSAGEFATLTCNILPGASAPAAASFSVKNLKVVDVNGKAVSGVTVTVK